MNSLIEINHLSTYFESGAGTVKAVDDISFRVREGETVCVVGESGCGKSITAMSIMGLVDGPHGKVVNGRIQFGDKDLLKISREEMRRIRGNDISIIFQEPMSSLNPVITIGKQIMEPLMLHQRLNRKQAYAGRLN